MDFRACRNVQQWRGVTGGMWSKISFAALLALFASLCAGADGNRPGWVLNVDALPVVRVHVRAAPDARTASTLGTRREGTGVVIDSSGLILTIGYLFVEADTIELSTADGKTVPATVLGFDHATGLGVLKALTPLSIRPVDFGESAHASELQLVLIVGFDGIAPAYIVSKRPFVGYWEYLLDEAIYTAPAAVNHPGAALLDREGRLLGISLHMVEDALGGYANIRGNVFVPIDVLKPVIGDFVANGHSTAKPRPWLGTNTREVLGHLIVTGVSPEGPAENAGLAIGDIIVSIQGVPIRNQVDFYRKLWARGNAGVEVMLDVLKDNHIAPYAVKSSAREQYLPPKRIY